MKLLDKILFFIICFIISLIYFNNKFSPVIMCISLIITCAFYVFDNKKIHVCLIIIFTILSFLNKEFLAFIPLILYESIFLNVSYIDIVLFIPFIKHFEIEDRFYLFLIILSVQAVVSKYKTDTLNKKKEDFIKLRDDSTEYSNLLREKNKQLILNQDYELNLATLNERNRISKELHDSIGHLLSRSLIQVGALKTIATDDIVKQGLKDLHNSLSEGMDSVRETIHNMRDSSFDMKVKTEELVNEFTFCKIFLDYFIKEQPPIGVKYCFISTLKESLSNIMKHSDATHVNVSMTELPGMYQLIIQDNGYISFDTKMKIEESMKYGSDMESMGISEMVERVNKLKGRINISIDKGLKIFISIPKKQLDY